VEIRNDPGVILDCVIVALVRASFRVKLNVQPSIIVEPYSDGNGGKYGHGFCMVDFHGDELVVTGEVGAPHGGYYQGEVVRVSLNQPDAFEVLARKIDENLKARR